MKNFSALNNNNGLIESILGIIIARFLLTHLDVQAGPVARWPLGCHAFLAVQAVLAYRAALLGQHRRQGQVGLVGNRSTCVLRLIRRS
jgi:hypothetical protein